jgi:hypothetical protein
MSSVVSQRMFGRVDCAETMSGAAAVVALRKLRRLTPLAE